MATRYGSAGSHEVSEIKQQGTLANLTRQVFEEILPKRNDCPYKTINETDIQKILKNTRDEKVDAGRASLDKIILFWIQALIPTPEESGVYPDLSKHSSHSLDKLWKENIFLTYSQSKANYYTTHWRLEENNKLRKKPIDEEIPNDYKHIYNKVFTELIPIFQEDKTKTNKIINNIVDLIDDIDKETAKLKDQLEPFRKYIHLSSNELQKKISNKSVLKGELLPANLSHQYLQDLYSKALRITFEGLETLELEKGLREFVILKSMKQYEELEERFARDSTPVSNMELLKGLYDVFGLETIKNDES